MIDLMQVDAQLRVKQQELEHRLDMLNKELQRQDREISKDSEDRAQDLENEEVAEAIVLQAQQELQQVQHAILRIKKGMYLQCELCEEDIEIKRLQSLPYTSLCRLCASDANH